MEKENKRIKDKEIEKYYLLYLFIPTWGQLEILKIGWTGDLKLFKWSAVYIVQTTN